MLTRDAFENITFQKSRVRAEIGATFEEFVVKLNATIDKLQDSYASEFMHLIWIERLSMWQFTLIECCILCAKK